MKNRKRIVVAFLLVAVMLLGVGFAAITGELTITGNLGSAAQKAEVVFTQVKVDWNDADAADGQIVGASVELTPVQTSGSTVTLGSNGNGLFAVSISALGMAEKADNVTFDFTIENRNKVDMYVTPSFDESNLNAFSVTSDWNGTTKKIEAGQSMTYKLTIKLANEIDIAHNEAFTIKLDATSTAPAND